MQYDGGMSRLGALGLLLGAFAFASEDAGVGAVLTVKVAVRSPSGKVACTLYAGPDGFPTDPRLGIQQRWCEIENGAATCRFDPIPAGTYAVACFHDENGNGTLDKNFLGIPKEGVCVSNNAKGSMGPPKYEAAKFNFAGTLTELSLQPRY